MEATTIVRHLRELEEEREIKILLAVESGSRAWGCASPDSDYDVRIIYVRRAEWYLSIDEGKDNIDYLEEALETVKETVLPKPPTVDKEPLNVFFREVLTKYSS